MPTLSVFFSRIAAGAIAASLLACANVQDPTPPSVLSDASVSVVTAREAGKGRGPTGISDRFTTNGEVFAFVSLIWPTDHAAWGSETFESRWYSGDRLVVKRVATFDIAKSPFNFWSSVFPVNLGPGPARYELYAEGRKVAEKTFEIIGPMPPHVTGPTVQAKPSA